MQYRKMKKTGDELSILGFGCMRLPEKNGRIQGKRAKAQIHYAIEHGVNYFDTAMPYHVGASEPLLGSALSGGLRNKVKIATKLSPWLVKTRADMDTLLNIQLSKLKTDHIDYYLLHSLQKGYWEHFESLGALEFLEQAKKDGKIVSTGFSFHGDKETFKTIIDSYDWDSCQIQYNYLDEENQAGTKGLKYAAEKNIGVIVMEPLRGGNLGKKSPPEVQSIWDEADIKRTPVEWALRWIWDHPEVTVVLSGMNEETHIEENIRIAGEALPCSLTEKELGLVNRAEKTFRKLMKAGCTGCRYCMPCPAGVDIPTCFELYNNLNVFGDNPNAKLFYMGRLYDLFGYKPSHASLCENCGNCEEACPQNLPIQDLLVDVANEFETTQMAILRWFVKRIYAFRKWLDFRKSR
jgi:predicted aldo/keto reductase-like oxidoreductase